jgi:hypothetical protein
VCHFYINLRNCFEARKEEWKDIIRCGKGDIFSLKVPKRKENISLNAIPLHTKEGKTIIGVSVLFCVPEVI